MKKSRFRAKLVRLCNEEYLIEYNSPTMVKFPDALEQLMDQRCLVDNNDDESADGRVWVTSYSDAAGCFDGGDPSLDYLASRIPVVVRTLPNGSRHRRLAVTIAGKYRGVGRTFTDAMREAVDKWDEAGRILDGETLQAAFQRVMRAAAKRGE